MLYVALAKYKLVLAIVCIYSDRESSQPSCVLGKEGAIANIRHSTASRVAIGGLATCSQLLYAAMGTRPMTYSSSALLMNSICALQISHAVS